MVRGSFLLTASLACLSSAVQGFRPLASVSTPSQFHHHNSLPATTTTHHSNEQQQQQPSVAEQLARKCAHGLLIGCLVFPQLAVAVSGGGLDYANIDITGQDFSNDPKAYKGKDFTQVCLLFVFVVLWNTVLFCSYVVIHLVRMVVVFYLCDGWMDAIFNGWAIIYCMPLLWTPYFLTLMILFETTQVIAKGTKFMNSNLQGCRFYKAYLVNADFSGADLGGAALEDTSMDGASLKGSVAAGAYFSASLLDVATLEDADFTDASIPLKTLPQVCARPDAKGTNPVTGVDTAESLMCP